MNAEPLLNRIAKVLAEHRLEAVMVGNAAAALHGAPVTTLDIDFMFSKTATNLKKLKAVARSLNAVIFKQYYPALQRFRITNDDQSMQLDFVAFSRGRRSIDRLWGCAKSVTFGQDKLRVAAAARERGAHQQNVSVTRRASERRKAGLVALKRESERALVEQIRRLLALPMNKRTHFLRVRHPSGGSHL